MMSSQSDTDRYGAVAVAVHWLTAVLIVVLLASGFRADDTTDAAAKIALLRVHAPLGLLILALTLFRIVWWLGFDSKPAPLDRTQRWQNRLAGAVHFLLYAVIVLMAASGLGMMILSGAHDVLWLGTGALPDFFTYAPRIPHGIGANLMLALLAVHILAALYHHFILRDATLRRMWFARGTR